MNSDKILKKLAKYKLEGLSHTDKDLISHLKGTYEILQYWNCHESLCIAGLCHSIYGTESYRNDPIDLLERENIQNALGNKAEKIIYLFGAHVKNSLWENLKKESDFSFFDRFEQKEVNISKNELSDLITLTLANWLEQRPRAPLEHQFTRKEEFLNSRAYLPLVAFENFIKAYDIKSK